MKAVFERKRALSLLLALVMIFAAFAPGAAAADARKTVHIQAKSFSRRNIYPLGNVSKSVKWDAMTEEIYSALKAGKKDVDLSKYKIPDDDDNTEHMAAIIFDTPKFLNMVSNITYTHSEGLVEEVTMKLNYSKNSFIKMEEACDEAVAKLTADLVNNTRISDAEKVLLIHDRIACLCAYDQSGLEDAEAYHRKEPNEDHSAYGPLVLGVGVCDGYAAAMSLCFDKLGMKNEPISSERLEHGWNLVYLNGEPFFVDTTWDDPSWDISGQVLHDELLSSSAKLKKSHNAKDYPTPATSTRYDQAYWTCSETAFQLIGDTLYYFDNENGTLCKRSRNGTSTVLKRFDDYWYADADQYEYWTGNYSKLASYAGSLVYSTPTKVYTYNVSTGATSVLYSPRLNPFTADFIYGMSIKDCTLYIDVNDSPNFDRNTKAKKQIQVELPHVKKAVDANPKTSCTDTGYTAGTVCEICGKVFDGVQTIAPGAHSWGPKTLLEPATAAKDGKFVSTCVTCSATQETVIAKASKISLSKTAFPYNDKVQKPSVIVKDSKGNALPADSYTVLWSNNAPKTCGKYTVTVSLKGNYSGSKSLTYSITPAQVKKLKQAKVTASAVSLKWNAAGAGAYYQIQCSSNKGKTWKDAVVVSKTKATVKDLKPGVHYWFRVLALDSTKKVAGKASAVLKTQTLCAAPKFVAQMSDEPGTVYVEWKKVTGAKGYQLYWSDDGKSWEFIETWDDTGVIINGFDNDKKAYIKIVPVNAYGKDGAAGVTKAIKVMH